MTGPSLWYSPGAKNSPAAVASALNPAEAHSMLVRLRAIRLQTPRVSPNRILFQRLGATHEASPTGFEAAKATISRHQRRPARKKFQAFPFREKTARDQHPRMTVVK